MAVQIVDHDAGWQEKFAQQRDLLSPALSRWLAAPIENERTKLQAGRRLCHPVSRRRATARGQPLAVPWATRPAAQLPHVYGSVMRTWFVYGSMSED